MDWVQSISAAIGYIDAHLDEELDMADIAQSAMLSPFYFQHGFAMYSDPREYKLGTSDENYHCELWIPVKRK